MKPRPRSATQVPDANNTVPRISHTSISAHENWVRVGKIAKRAHASEVDVGDSSISRTSSISLDSPASKSMQVKFKHLRQHRKNSWKGKMMDLPYFLEMVDLKHRYGSNLRTYHAEWKKANTHENFFYWLDCGEGRNVDLQLCSRERLEQEQVRYLSREERMDYLVTVDSEDYLCWIKNGEKIDTTAEWRDSIHGIVRRGDRTPMFREKVIRKQKIRASRVSQHQYLDSTDS